MFLPKQSNGTPCVYQSSYTDDIVITKNTKGLITSVNRSMIMLLTERPILFLKCSVVGRLWLDAAWLIAGEERDMYRGIIHILEEHTPDVTVCSIIRTGLDSLTKLYELAYIDYCETTDRYTRLSKPDYIQKSIRRVYERLKYKTDSIEAELFEDAILQMVLVSSDY